MDWSQMLWALLPIGTALLGGFYVSWKAKAAADGVQDWKDDVVKAVDGLMAEASAKKDAE